MEHPEKKLQEKLRKFLASRLKPEIVWMASANGGYRDPHTAISLKSMGVLPGAPDLCFCLHREFPTPESLPSQTKKPRPFGAGSC